MSEKNKVHIFGNLCLADPSYVLPENELDYANELLSLIGCADGEQPERKIEGKDSQVLLDWNLDRAFERLQEKEFAWWEERGLTRPKEYLVRPSGSTNAAVACHLYNPTFATDDPCGGETEDLSSPSIVQLNRAGFSTENNCLLFDHIARRDISAHCKDAYPEDLLDIYEEFTFTLRAAMKAKVEICWGANVRQRMLKKLDLKPLRLWNEFMGLTLYLELTPDKKSLKRFIIFVAHPQRFMYVKGDGEKAQAWRRRFGISQDLALDLAARLSGIKIPPRFYELDPRLLQNLCRPRHLTAKKDAWTGQAMAQLKKAFPDANLSTETSHRVKPTKEDKTALQNVFQALEKLGPDKLNQTVNMLNMEDDKFLRRRRLQKIVDYWHGLEGLSYAFIPNAKKHIHHLQATKTQVTGYLSDSLRIELQESDFWDWEDLPTPMIDFIGAQDGLKFRKRKIMCRSDLEVAFYLLQRCEGNPQVLDLLTLAFTVLTAYGWWIARSRKPPVDSALILREHPYDVMSRKCSGCRKEHLDDPFAYWSKSDPSLYIFWYCFRSSCGRPECQAKNVRLIPFDNLIKYSRASFPDLQMKSLGRFDRWFLLRPEEFGLLPDMIQVQCQGKGCGETKLVKSRWTAHNPPRFVIAVHGCTKCLKKTNWIPFGFPILHSSNLCPLWKRFHEHPGFDITGYPRMPDIYFDKSLTVGGRVAALIEAQRLAEIDNLTKQKRKEP